MHLAIHLNKEKKIKIRLRKSQETKILGDSTKKKKNQRPVQVQSRKSPLLLGKNNQSLIDKIYFLTTNNKGTSSEQLSDGESMGLYPGTSLASKKQNWLQNMKS